MRKSSALINRFYFWAEIHPKVQNKTGMSKTRKVRTTGGLQEAVGIIMAPPLPLRFWRPFGMWRGFEAQAGPSRAIGIKYAYTAVAFRVIAIYIK